MRMLVDAATEDAVRRAIWALMAIGAFAAIDAAPAAAGAMPFCIKGCDFGGGAGDCSFSTYQQCQATASGRDATCATNPYFNANAEMLPDRSRMSKRKY
jgi:Protein of unknown function (DUF3551)